MKWSFRLAAIAAGFLLAAGATDPVEASPAEARQVTAWRYDLHRSYCAGNWTEAISLAGAMMGSQEVRPHERLWLFLLRQDMFNFQRSVAEFSGCRGRVLAGITAAAAQASIEPASIEPAAASTSSVNWSRGLAAIGADRSLPQQAPSPVIPASTNVVDRMSFDPTDQNPTITDCQAFSEGERRVADGSTSNQWNYEIWRDANYQFRVRYWRQNETCEQAQTTQQYPTQNQAWQDFRCNIGLETGDRCFTTL